MNLNKLLTRETGDLFSPGGNPVPQRAHNSQTQAFLCLCYLLAECEGEGGGLAIKAVFYYFVRRKKTLYI